MLLDAALGPAAWPQALARTAQAVGAIGADLHFLRGETLLTSYMGAQPPEVLAEYTERFINREPRSLALRRLKPGQVVTDLDFVDMDTVRSHDYYADFLRRADMGYCIAATPVRTGVHLAYFGLHFPRGQEAPDKNLMATVQRFQPHLARAVTVHLKLAEAELQNGLYLGALNRLSTGIAVLNRHGQILLMNASAKQLTDERKAFKVERGRLRCSNSAPGSRLDLLVCSAVARTADQGGAMLVDAIQSRYSVVVTPTPLEYLERTGAAVFILITELDADRSLSTAAYIRQLFGLTRAEARMAEGLLTGRALRALAAEDGITYESARFLLKQVFAKVGVHKQSELVAILSRAIGGAG
ncbi:MAG: hypothetical protein WD928_13940 [Gammaproteobacteria bacterium]